LRLRHSNNVPNHGVDHRISEVIISTKDENKRDLAPSMTAISIYREVTVHITCKWVAN